MSEKLLREQAQALNYRKAGRTMKEIAVALNISKDAAWRRVKAAEKRERLDPELAERLSQQGIHDLGGLHSGWLLEKDKTGSGHSLYFYLGADEEKLSFADAVVESLSEIPRLDPIAPPSADLNQDYANWIALADLHVGENYGDPQLEIDFNLAIDDLVRRLPPAKHAVLFELGDLLEINDHKGITPGSGNHLEVKIGPEEFLKTTILGISLVRRALYRLLETHETVEAHFIKGNHDPSAHVGIMVGLAEHFRNNPRIQIHISTEEFRVVEWGRCAAFPHHGDTLKWPALKDVFADQFPNAWARATAIRLIMTAHFHHDRKQDLVGAAGRHFQTTHGPNGWAKARGMFSRGSLTALTMDALRGPVHETISPIRLPSLEEIAAVDASRERT